MSPRVLRVSYRMEVVAAEGESPKVTSLRFMTEEVEEMVMQFRQFLYAAGYHPEMIDDMIPNPYEQPEICSCGEGCL